MDYVSKLKKAQPERQAVAQQVEEAKNKKIEEHREQEIQIHNFIKQIEQAEDFLSKQKEEISIPLCVFVEIGKIGREVTEIKFSRRGDKLFIFYLTKGELACDSVTELIRTRKIDKKSALAMISLFINAYCSASDLKEKLINIKNY